MKLWLFLVLGSAIPVFAGPAVKELIFSADFNSPQECLKWQMPSIATFDPAGGCDGSGAVKFAAEEKCDAMMTIDIPIAEVRGCGVLISGYLKGEKIEPPALSYLGHKMMLIITTPERTMYPDIERKTGSYDWQKFSYYVWVPDDATRFQIGLGLQGTTGTVWADQIRLYRVRQERKLLSPANRENEIPVRPEYRGVMSGNDLSEAAFQNLHSWNANLMRFQLSRGNADCSSPAAFLDQVRKELARLDRVLPLARKYGVKLVIDLHFGPKTRITALAGNDLACTEEQKQLLIQAWREIAAKYRNEPAIYGYDILNEPGGERFFYTQGDSDWNDLAEQVARAIREIDGRTPIIVESINYASPESFSSLRPIDLPHIIYSFHFYLPHLYTHQGVGNYQLKYSYPGMVAGEKWDIDTLRRQVQPVIDFQKKYRVKIYVGEFGATYISPGAERYLADAITVFEENGWDWTYHAYREWPGWSCEHSGTDISKPQPSPANPRKRVLLSAFAENHNRP